MRTYLVAVALLVSAAPSAASGGLSCEGAGEKSLLSIGAGVTRGMGSPLFSFEGRLTIDDETVQEDLRVVSFALPHVAQYWSDADGVRLRLYRERQNEKPHGYVEVEILTRAGQDDSTVSGDYTVSVYDATDAGSEGRTWTFTGRVDCGVE